MYKYSTKNKFIFSFPLLLVFILFIILGINKHNTAEVIIGVNNLNSHSVIDVLEEDFNNQPGIQFIDGSLSTNTIILQVQDNNLEVATIDELLNNWGCSIKDINYRIINN